MKPVQNIFYKGTWVVLLLGVVGLWGCGQMMSGLLRRVLYPRHLIPAGDYREARTGDGTETVWLETDAGRVECRVTLGRGVSADRPGPAVIFAHGNGELIGQWRAMINAYARSGVTAMEPEYRGYGKSAGSPTQAEIVEDYIQFYDKLASRTEVDSERIVFHGRSLGGGVVCALAAKRPPTAMILQSTFTSVTAMAKRFWFPGWLVADRYDNLAVVSQLNRPLLLFHGRRDNAVPCQESEKLHAAASDSKLIVYDCGHNDCPPDFEAFWREVTGFLEANGVIGVGTSGNDGESVRR